MGEMMADPFGVPRHVLILGATSDIATDMATTLARLGTPMFTLTSRHDGDLAPLREDLETAGAAVHTAALDALATATHHDLIARLWATSPAIDLVVVAFGTLGDDDSDLTPVEVVTTNFTGAVSVLEHIAARMQLLGRGTIAVVSSVAAERPRASNHIYAASKAGLDAYARGLGDRLANDEVDVLVIRPGFVRTRMTAHLPQHAPLSIDPSDVTDALLRGLSTGRPVVWAPRSARLIMAALRHLPTKTYRRLIRRFEAIRGQRPGTG